MKSEGNLFAFSSRMIRSYKEDTCFVRMGGPGQVGFRDSSNGDNDGESSGLIFQM
jgi:hypothetical protein